MAPDERCRRHGQPIVDLSAFVDRTFAIGCLFSFILGMALFGAGLAGQGVAVAASGAGEVTLVAWPAVELRLLPSGEDWDGWRWRVVDPAGFDAEAGEFRGGVPRRARLAPGAWRVVVVDPQGAAWRTFDVTLSEEPLELPLAR